MKKIKLTALAALFASAIGASGCSTAPESNANSRNVNSNTAVVTNNNGNANTSGVNTLNANSGTTGGTTNSTNGNATRNSNGNR